MKKIVLHIAFFTWVIMAPSAISFGSPQKDIDQLKQKLEMASPAEKNQILLDLSAEYRYLDNKKSLEYALKALSLANNENETYKIALSHKAVGVAHLIMNELPQARQHFEEALKGYKAINNSEGIGGIYNNLGILFRYQSNYDSSVFYYRKALKIKTQLNNKQGIAKTYNNLANLYNQIGKMDSALLLLLKSAAFYQKKIWKRPC